ncbi:prenyltransferase/squalene oxidase repeat-containing protein [Singulisphaera acidiphila]|uniref:Squalene cyclase C-terminal domain-containing protein n=1 Tax=Singulisphaera acidiphila (strain ATCC BAA-1392 / DSM 18658 / VKM B-2454 / MOB10) TaxID=886293 RepID=L0DG78_SINAD|nr:prenyltransferase/squalene oxidase repeat-containing protein [Singulisphaera acidiphila]AGA27855.1 hypothetical protein Sinac_3605 [Singulisphaera acidiphila DSM 18658]
MRNSQRPRLLRVLRVKVRRVHARLDRLAPFLMLWVPSWGTSILLHAAGLLLLALYLYAHGGGPKDLEIQATIPSQLTEDLLSLTPSDHAGDPFTTQKSDETPSLSLEAAPPDVKTINQPALPTLTQFSPELMAPEIPTELARVPGKGKGMAMALHVEGLSAPFSGRQGMSRAQLVRREGGTVRSEKAVEDGLDWLVRHQRLDGGWSLNFHGQCQGAGCPEQVCLESETAATGLALLPLLGAGHIHTVKTRYQMNVRKGLEWLVQHQQPSGELYINGGDTARMYSHAIAAMALCEAYGISGEPTLRRPAQRALDFVIASQNSQDGGWRYFPGQSGDTSVFGWQMFALRSARLAGLQVPRNVTKGCKIYLDLAAVDESRTMYAYRPGRGASPVMTAEALLTRQYLGWPREFPPLVKGVAHVAADLEQSAERNIYYWYYATQLLHNMQNKDWPRWNSRVRDGLISMQVGGNGCDRGSWDPFTPQPDLWGRSAGRHFLTALSLLTLEVYYRYLPLYQPSDSDKDKPELPREEPRDPAAKPEPLVLPVTPPAS